MILVKKYTVVDSLSRKILRKVGLPDNILPPDFPGAIYVPVTDDLFEADVYYANGEVLQKPPPPTTFSVWDEVANAWVPDLAAAKQRYSFLAVEEYRRRKELPLSYDNKTVDTDADAREQLMFKAFEFAERARLNQPAGAAARVWENADNTFFRFDTDIQFRNWLGGFVIALSDRTAQQRLALRQHVQNIKALTTVEDILAYDITVGWPP